MVRKFSFSKAEMALVQLSDPLEVETQRMKHP
jgi:hypothetical protein